MPKLDIRDTDVMLQPARPTLTGLALTCHPDSPRGRCFWAISKHSQPQLEKLQFCGLPLRRTAHTLWYFSHQRTEWRQSCTAVTRRRNKSYASSAAAVDAAFLFRPRPETSTTPSTWTSAAHHWGERHLAVALGAGWWRGARARPKAKVVK